MEKLQGVNMYVEREMREKLAALSKLVLGAPSAYMRALDKGVFMPVFNQNGKKLYSEKKWFTPETLLTRLQDLQKQKEEVLVKKI